jgi:hypothetical protein
MPLCDPYLVQRQVVELEEGKFAYSPGGGREAQLSCSLFLMNLKGSG